MKVKNLLTKWWLLQVLLIMVGTMPLKAQVTDTSNVFNPALTGVHLVYAELIYHDVNENDSFDAAFVLSEDSIDVWGDYSAVVVFYNDGIHVRDGSFVYTNQIIPVPGELYKVWIAVNVPNMTYRTYVQGPGMDEPVLLYDGDAPFRNTNITEINRWSTIHNPDAEPDYLTVEELRLETDSDPSLASLGVDVGTIDPEFDPFVSDYELALPYGTQSVTIDAVPSGMGASVAYFDGVGNELPADGTIPFSNEGVDVEIAVTALDGAELSYYLSIFVAEGTSDPSLREIEVSEGAIDPAFNRDINEYTVVVPIGTQSVTVTGIPNYPDATVAGDGTVNLTNGSGTANIEVTSADGDATEQYTVNVVEADGNNYSLYLPGENGNNSHVDISGLGLNTLPYTIEMWIKPDGMQNANSGLLYGRSENGHAGVQYASGWQGETQIRFMSNIADEYGTLTSPVPTDAWHHVAVVLTEETRTVYLNGVENSTTINSSPYDYSQGELYIGWDHDGDNRAFKGWIDEVRVWNDSIGAETLNANKYEVLNGDEQGLLAYWNFDLNNSAKAIDMTDNNLHGAITGGTYAESFPRANLELASLSVDVGDLYPEFSTNRTEYNVVLPEETASFEISAQPVDASASITGTGSVDSSSGKGEAIITVTSEDGVYSQDYVIKYVVDGPLALRHAYTFADGTARDMEGNAHGTVNGGEIIKGAFTASEDGDYIVLPAEEIAINEFASITLEAYVQNGENEGIYTMLAYFGGLSGANSYWVQPTREDNSSRTEVITGTGVTASGAEAITGMAQHFVSVLTNDSICWYIDGTLVANVELPEDVNIAKISTENAWLGYGGWSDPSWLGSLLEFNIYSGVMDEETVAARSATFPVEDETTNAALSAITTLDEDTIAGFNPSTFEYDIVLEEGTTEVPELIGVTANPAASVVVTQASELSGSTTFVVTSEDGSYENTYTVNFTVDTTTSVVEAETGESEVIVYPTITSGTFTVETGGRAAAITVYDMSGRVVLQKAATTSVQTFDVPRAGMYILRVELEGDNQVFRVIKTN